MSPATLNKLKKFMAEKEGHIDEIMETLSVVGFDDRLIDYVSNGLWAKKKKLIGLNITKHLEREK